MIDREPKKEMFNKQLIEIYIAREDEVYQKFKIENEAQLIFVRKIIEQEFAHDTDESAGFMQKYPMKTFEELRPLIKGRRLKSQQALDQTSFVDKINLSHLKLAKPNMFEIVRAKALNMNSDDVKKLLKVNFDVYGLVKTVRGLMDSYWNMMTVYTDQRQYTTFCEFAYVWMGNFYVNPVTCRVEEQHRSRKSLSRLR